MIGITPTTSAVPPSAGRSNPLPRRGLVIEAHASARSEEGIENGMNGDVYVHTSCIAYRGQPYKVTLELPVRTSFDLLTLEEQTKAKETIQEMKKELLGTLQIAPKPTIHFVFVNDECRAYAPKPGVELDDLMSVWDDEPEFERRCSAYSRSHTPISTILQNGDLKAMSDAWIVHKTNRAAQQALPPAAEEQKPPVVEPPKVEPIERAKASAPGTEVKKEYFLPPNGAKLIIEEVKKGSEEMSARVAGAINFLQEPNKFDENLTGALAILKQQVLPKERELRFLWPEGSVTEANLAKVDAFVQELREQAEKAEAERQKTLYTENGIEGKYIRRDPYNIVATAMKRDGHDASVVDNSWFWDRTTSKSLSGILETRLQELKDVKAEDADEFVFDFRPGAVDDENMEKIEAKKCFVHYDLRKYPGKDLYSRILQAFEKYKFDGRTVTLIVPEEAILDVQAHFAPKQSWREWLFTH